MFDIPPILLSAILLAHIMILLVWLIRKFRGYQRHLLPFSHAEIARSRQSFNQSNTGLLVLPHKNRPLMDEKMKRARLNQQLDLFTANRRHFEQQTIEQKYSNQKLL